MEKLKVINLAKSYDRDVPVLLNTLGEFAGR